MTENFQTLGLSPEFIQVLEEQQITQPTQIQAKAIPALMNGENILGLAATGSGKTLALKHQSPYRCVYGQFFLP